MRGEISTTRHVLFQSFNSMRKPFSKLLIYLGCLEESIEKMLFVSSTSSSSQLESSPSYFHTSEIIKKQEEGKKEWKICTNSNTHTPRFRRFKCVVKTEGFSSVFTISTRVCLQHFAHMLLPINLKPLLSGTCTHSVHSKSIICWPNLNWKAFCRHKQWSETDSCVCSAVAITSTRDTLNNHNDNRLMTKFCELHAISFENILHVDTSDETKHSS